MALHFVALTKPENFLIRMEVSHRVAASKQNLQDQNLKADAIEARQFFEQNSVPLLINMDQIAAVEPIDKEADFLQMDGSTARAIGSMSRIHLVGSNNTIDVAENPAEIYGIIAEIGKKLRQAGATGIITSPNLP